MKIKNLKVIISITILSAIINSCTAVSPSLQMTKPLEKNQFAIQASLEYLPESTDYNKYKAYGGETLLLRYGLTENTTMQTKLWVPNNNYKDEFKWGLTIMPNIFINPNSDYKIFITPAFNFYQSNFKFEYASLGVYSGLVFPEFCKMTFYTGLSVHSAWIINGSNQSTVAFTANLGTRYRINKTFDINFELTGSNLNIYNSANYDCFGYYYFKIRNGFLITPTLGFGINL